MIRLAILTGTAHGNNQFPPAEFYKCTKNVKCQLF
jgi:hypothetical protein